MITTTKLSVLRRLLQNSRQFHSSGIKKAYEGPGKTTVDILDDKIENAFLITKCVEIGFRLGSGSLILGPIAIFPKALLSWNVATARDINRESLSLFTALYPPLDIIVIGMETSYPPEFQTKIRGYLKEYNIRAEILPVLQACGAYNFLVSEGRYVAAGMIPPLFEKSPTPDDVPVKAMDRKLDRIESK